jgi:poly-beta-1,6-N-acetyl-D-glucosamine synthase
MTFRPQHTSEVHGPQLSPMYHRGETPQMRDRLAVVIPAHNEEGVIAATLESVTANRSPRDVYVFCDACTDNTAAIARTYLPPENVIDHQVNIGKSRGLEYMLEHHIGPAGYRFTAVVDADTTVDPDFFEQTLRVVRRPGVAAATGQVKSRWYRNPFSVYRTFLYAVWQSIFKRIQSHVGSIVIASGCSTVWRTDVLRRAEWDHRMSTEDFSLTMQVHRKQLGKIRYVASGVVWTQDPFSLRAYVRQSYRWSRAFWESIRKYRVGLRWISLRKPHLRVSMLDVSTALLLLVIFVYTVVFLAGPLLIIWPVTIDLRVFALETREQFAIWMIMQYLLIAALALLVAVAERRPLVFLYTPAIIFLIYVDLFVSLAALASTVRSQYRKGTQSQTSAWVSPERQGIPGKDARIK